MKKLAFLLALALVTISGTLSAQNTITAENIQVNISAATSREDLSAIRTQCLEQGIEFNYTPRFNQNRQLTGIAFILKRTGGDLLGQTGMIELTVPNSKASFRLHKENNKFVADCIGSCE